MPVTYFTAISGLRDAEIDLGRSALELARIAYPDLDVGHYLRTIDRLAAVTPRASSPLSQLEHINHTLFDLEGLRGNRTDYYDPRNCYLNDVLERRLGIPITLSVIYMEVARRLGLELQGVGMPGHFIVKLPDRNGDQLIDPFDQGRVLTLEDCQKRLQQIYGRRASLESYMLEPTEKKQILARILNNLKHIWIDKRQYKRALPAVQLHLALYPQDSEALKQRAWLSARLNDYRSALEDLERCGSASHKDDDWAEMARVLADLKAAAHSILN